MRYFLFFMFLWTLPIVIFSQADTEWLHYGNDAGGQRFADIDQVTPQNVKQLQLAWTFRTQEQAQYKETPWLEEKSAFEATPIMVNDHLYFSTPSNRVFAIDAQTGKQKWLFNPQVILRGSFSELTNRGVSYWKGDRDGEQIERILLATVDGRLFSLDAQTGQPDPAFGTAGFIDLKRGVGRVQVTSAPAIFDHLVITGSSIGDNGRTNMPKGVVRAYDIRTGELVWDFDPIPTTASAQSDTTWLNNSHIHTGAANAWSTISIDEQNGLAFIPTSSPSPDFYGGERLGNNDMANSLVAVDAKTGGYRWHFQVVHHDLWDYDIAAQPVLFDFKGEIPAVAIGTKMGFIYVLNRLTGEPLFPIEERPVPRSLVPGEKASPTQPFPTKPLPLGLQNVTLDDIWAPDEAALAVAKERFQSLRYEGIFTPPDLGYGTLIAPGNTGGINWSGMSYDPKRRILVTNTNNLAHIVSLFPRHDNALQQKVMGDWDRNKNDIRAEVTGMHGTPYFMARTIMAHGAKDDFWMQTKPPWGTLVGIDMNNGDKIWEKPLGVMMDPSIHPEAVNWGSISLGGTIVTSSGLTFIAGTFDNFLRAFDTATGELLWQYELPAAGNATPMSYRLNGKQYIVIAAGGHGKVSFSKKGDYILAFTLPD